MYTDTCTILYIHTYIYIYMHMHTYIRAYIYIYICICIHTRIHVCTHAHRMFLVMFRKYLATTWLAMKGPPMHTPEHPYKADKGVSENRGPYYSTLNSRILMIRAPK